MWPGRPYQPRLNALAEVINVSRDDERKVEEEEKIAPLRRLTRALNLPFHELKGDPVGRLVEEAQAKRATLLVLGQSTKNTWQEKLFGSFTDKLLRRLESIDIYIVGDPARRWK